MSYRALTGNCTVHATRGSSTLQTVGSWRPAVAATATRDAGKTRRLWAIGKAS